MVLVYLAHVSLLSQISTFMQERNNLLLLDGNVTSLIMSFTTLLSPLHANVCTLNTQQHLFCFSSRISSRRWPWGAGEEAGAWHTHKTWLKVFSCLEFLAFKHRLTWSEKLLHIPGEAEVEEERQLLHLTPLKQPFSLVCCGQ